jgi:hypothetical protein
MVTVTGKEIRAYIDETVDRVLVMDGYDDCILGLCERFGQETIVAYDYEKVIAQHMADGMDRDEAEEFLSFNQLGAGMGELTPCFITVLNGPTGCTDCSCK